MNNYKEIVMDYYHCIDNDHFEEAFLLFSSSIMYHRCEKIIQGIDALREFYLHQRKLVGKHTILFIEQIESTVVVRCKFHGDKKLFSFCDFFEFDSSKKLSSDIRI